MAFTEIVASTLENKPKVYVCLAADVKTVAGINNGSILYEIDAAGDVKNQYLFFDGAWKPHKKLVEGSMTLSGSIEGVAIQQTEIIATNTTILNGATYESPNQTILKGTALSAYVRLEASKTITLTMNWKNLAGQLGMGSDVLLASGSRINGVGRVTSIPSKVCSLAITNGAGEDIVVKFLGYTVCG